MASYVLMWLLFLLIMEQYVPSDDMMRYDMQVFNVQSKQNWRIAA